MKKSKAPLLEPFEDYSEHSPLRWSPSEQKSTTLSLRELEKPESTGPVLPLTDGNGQVDFFAPISLLAIMAHPREVDAQNQFQMALNSHIAGNIDRQVKAGTRTLPDPTLELFEKWIGKFAPNGLFSLVETPSLKSLWDSFRVEEGRGAVVGHVLWWIVILAQAGEKPSVNKAEFLVRHWRKKIPQVPIAVPEGKEQMVETWLKSMPEGKGRLLEAWSKFRPVAHLWAAYFLWGMREGKGSPLENAEFDNPINSISPLMPETLPNFLALSEIIRRKGLSIYPHGQRVPILDSEETWQPPPDLQLPNAALTIDPLPRAAVDVLKTYRA